MTSRSADRAAKIAADAPSLADYIRKTVDAAPRLTTGQRDRLALLLRGGGDTP